MPISSSWLQAPWDSLPEFLLSKWTLALIVLMEHPLWREDGPFVCNCCLALPAQSFWGPSPIGLMTTSQIRNFPTWRARSPYLYPPARGWSGYTHRDWVPFSSFLTTRRATVEVFDPASIRVYWPLQLGRSSDISSEQAHRKHRFQPFFRCCYGRLPSDSPDIFGMFTVRYQATVIVSLFVSRRLPSNSSISDNILSG
jgi:hypothetical protein